MWSRSDVVDSFGAGLGDSNPVHIRQLHCQPRGIGLNSAVPLCAFLRKTFLFAFLFAPTLESQTAHFHIIFLTLRRTRSYFVFYFVSCLFQGFGYCAVELYFIDIRGNIMRKYKTE